ncbi:MAG TPA: hypothetical protein VKZ50_04365 [bacterium]|nr:hypothetical protein [bacterium]
MVRAFAGVITLTLLNAGVALAQTVPSLDPAHTIVPSSSIGPGACGILLLVSRATTNVWNGTVYRIDVFKQSALYRRDSARIGAGGSCPDPGV